MSKHGKFIAKNLMNKELELFVDIDSEWLSYADGSVQSYTLIVATATAYDEESGVLTMVNSFNQKFYLCEEFIRSFWESKSGFKFDESTTSTLRHGKGLLKSRNSKKDIM